MNQISKLKTTALIGAAAFGASLLGTDNANADQLYTVQSGETLSQISQDKTGDKDNFQKIADDNGIQDPNLILVGQQITIKDEYVNQEQLQNQDVQTQNNYVTQQESYVAPTTTSSATQDYNYSNQNDYSQNYSQQNYSTGWSGVDYSQSNQTQTNQSAGSSSVYDQFIAAGGTQELWDNIVMPESGGNPNAVNGRYRGLFQGDSSYIWPTGDVATQTKGALKYISDRYGSISNAISYRTTRGYY